MNGGSGPAAGSRDAARRRLRTIAASPAREGDAGAPEAAADGAQGRRDGDPLERVDADLRVHPRRRLAVVEELAADLEALEDELVARGLERGKAREAARRRLVPGAAAISALEATHGPDRSRAAPVVWLRRWERLAVLALTLSLTAWLGLGALRGLGRGNAFVWIELALVALLIANWAAAALELWVGEDLRRHERRRYERRHAGLIVAAFAAGALGTAVEAYALIELATPAPPPSPVWGAVGRVTSTAALGLAAPVLGLLAWLSLTPRLIRYERIEGRIRRLFVPRSPRLENGEREP